MRFPWGGLPGKHGIKRLEGAGKLFGRVISTKNCSPPVSNQKKNLNLTGN
jgi:hypothetical protein